MNVLSRLFAARSEQAESEHAVIVHFRYDGTDLQPLYDLERSLEAAIAEAGAGEFDGDDLAPDGSDGYLCMYGPDGDRLFAVVRPVLEACAFMRGARVKVRYGLPTEGIREVEHVLSGERRGRESTG